MVNLLVLSPIAKVFSLKVTEHIEYPSFIWGTLAYVFSPPPPNNLNT